MKAQDFGKTAPGKLVPTIEGALAFLPDPLPPRRILDLEPMINLLASASQSLGELAGIGGIMTNPYLLIRPFLRQEAVASSRIEGTVTSVRQLALFESGMDIVDETPDAREVHNYVRALEHGITRLHELPICLRMLNEMHAILLEDVTDHRGARVRAGQIRTEQNWIGGTRRIKDARYVPPPPQQVLSALDAFEKYMQVSESDLPLLVRVALLHYQFEAIHPYPDGNGRLGRLVIPLILCERKALPQPLLYLSSYFERHRDDYIDLMFDVSARGLWERWIEFFLRGVETECRATVAKIRRLQDMRQDFTRRVQRARSSVLLNRLIDLFFEHPIMFVPAIARQLDISYNAAKNNLKRLAEEGIVKEDRFKGRKFWIAQDILNVTTDDKADA